MVFQEMLNQKFFPHILIIFYLFCYFIILRVFHQWVLLEEVHWRQKSRELWLKEGDRNTGYFHRMTNAHRRNNSMDRIMINGELLTEDQEVRDEIGRASCRERV